MKILSKARGLFLSPTLIILMILCALAGSIRAQFLFTYEINQDDDGRAPKSSLFDPSSFKIVTPSQLQSSYQKISSQIEVGIPAATAATPESPLNTQQPAQVQAEQQQQQQAVQQQPTTLVGQPPAAAVTGAEVVAQQVSAAPRGEQPSLLKQTSAALQSFADLFSLSGPSSSQSRSPLSALQSSHSAAINPNGLDQQAEARSLHEHWTREQQKSHQVLASTLNNDRQQAGLSNLALNSFTTTPSSGQHQPTQPASPASYWLTSNPLNTPDGNYLVQIKQHHPHPQQSQQQQQQQQQRLSVAAPPIPVAQPPPLPAPMPMRMPLTAPQSMIESLISLGHRQARQRQAPPSQLVSFAARPPQVKPESAQSSFLSTPTDYYPQPGSAAAIQEPVVSQQPPVHEDVTVPTFEHHHQLPQQLPAIAAVSTPATIVNHHQQHQGLPQRVTINFAPHQPSAAATTTATTVPSSGLLASVAHNQNNLAESGQLQPPANMPGNFALAQPAAPNADLHHQQHNPFTIASDSHHKSAEESLISYRQQQQHEQQSALFAAQKLQQQQQQQQRQQQPQQQQHHHHHHHHHQQQQQQQHAPQRVNRELPSSQQAAESYHQQQQRQQPQPQHQQQSVAQSQPRTNHQATNDIPKVSPQIYESFLLQQRDQHEKHMELLKQQQELNRLLELKHKQQESEAKRRRKKEELDKEARKKALREQEAARKLRLEQEERESRRKRDEGERKRAEERRYREYLEARERERKERETQLKRLRQIEEEQRELKLRLEREKEDELAERRRLEALEEKRRQEKEAEEAANKQANYLRQQEELKKLLELKQKEDEARQQRQRQVALQQQLEQQQQRQKPQRAQRRLSQASKAGKLALEFKERTGAAGWGVPIRSRTPTFSQTVPPPTEASSSATPSYSSSSSLSPSTTTTATTTPTTTATPTTVIASTVRPSRFGGGRIRGHLVKKQRISGANSTVDEKLIRQKIPLYSGPGQYGLYRGGNNSDSQLANDLAALLDSVSLPPSTSTTMTTTITTTTKTTTTPAPSSAADSSEYSTLSSHSRLFDSVTPGFAPDYSSSLSPLLAHAERVQLTVPTSEQPPVANKDTNTNNNNNNEPFFDDDVPRRPARATKPTSSPSSSSPSPSSSSWSSSSTTQALPSALVVTQRSRFANETLTSSGAQATPSGGSGNSRMAHIGLASLPPDSDNDGIPGRAGIEYPVLSSVPQTSFSCSKQPLNGYYADTETACQVVHLCQGGAQSSILCPNGTIFNQEKFSCQWWYEVNCSRAPIFYQLNDNLYKSLPGTTDDSSSSGDSTRVGKKDSISGNQREANKLIPG